MPNMRAVQVARAGGPLEVVERPVPEPGPGTVRIKVQACGICHSDSITKDGHFPGMNLVTGMDRAGDRAPGASGPVDEIPQKKYLLHIPGRAFSQVRGLAGGKLIYYPQPFAQAVHKLCRLVHRLSTALRGFRLCCRVPGG